MMKSAFLLSCLMSCLLLLSTCQPGSREQPGSNARRARVEKTARDFFATYAERQDWEHFLSFYRYDMQFEDVALQIAIFNKEDYKHFQDWPSVSYKPVAPGEPSLVLQELIVSDSTAVGYGYFNPFFLNGQRYDWRWGSQFTTWLFFDDQLKIRRQVDFVEYPDWVLEEVIQQYRRSPRR